VESSRWCSTVKSVEWASRRTVITGGSSGIGKQVAEHLLRLGAHVAIVADGADKLARAEADLKRISPHVWAYRCDVSRSEDIAALVRAYRSAFGAPQVIVNNAGYAVYEPFERMSSSEIHRLFDVNLSGAALLTRAFLPDMIRSGGGDVVFVSSIAGRIPMTPCSVYSAAKHGMVALGELLRVELARFNVRVQVVCPGRVETDFFAHESFQKRAPRREAARTVPIEVVSRAIIDAVERDRFMTTVPRHYAVLAWLAASLPAIFKPLWHRLLASRVASVYDELAKTELR
jgi:uncharacterized protein